MKKDVLMVGSLWLLITIAGVAGALSWDYLPLVAAEQGRVIDHAFRVLVFQSIPVSAFLFSVLIYSVLRFRRREGQTEDGPPIHTNRPAMVTWLLVTTGLTIFLIIFPGTTGLLELRNHGQTSKMLPIQVEGSRWTWKVTYPNQNVTSFSELVLPVGQEVHFDVTSTDVIHAFWVPAFRMKVDAVPGRVTSVNVTPDLVGTFDDDTGFRLQCAELCGLAHFAMSIPVRVVEPAEFDAWVARTASAGRRAMR